jgi:hypothetical protein
MTAANRASTSDENDGRTSPPRPKKTLPQRAFSASFSLLFSSSPVFPEKIPSFSRLTGFSSTPSLPTRHERSLGNDQIPYAMAPHIDIGEIIS